MEKNFLIYYFSGTGNARNVAQWFAGAAAEKDIPAETIDIAKIDRKKIESPLPGSLIGFVSPTHGFNYPPAMMYFIFRFPGTRKTKDERRRTKDEPASDIQYPRSSIRQ
jgi:flavodoxin